ncbi:MAG: glycoside hydrolase family 88 protein [Bacteroidota bacterium]
MRNLRVYPTSLAYLLFLGLLSVSLPSCANAQAKLTSLESAADAPMETAFKKMLSNRLDQLAKKVVADLEVLEPTPYNFPHAIGTDFKMRKISSADWTSGFYPGIMWYLYDHSQDERLKTAAKTWMTFIEREQYNTNTHDLGFMVYNSFGNAYEITGDETYKPIIVQTAESLASRYNEKVGCIRSWDFAEHVWSFPVIIDNMMNLELLFEAYKLSGKQSLYDIAVRHAETTMEHHFRPDNSSFHVVDYSPTTGKVRNKQTHQGYADESAWSRGQAWGLYGYAIMYRETKEQRFLEQAKKIADFMFQHKNLPKDHIMYWDYNAPFIPNEPRDVSAATIAAAGLIKMATLDPNNAEQYLGWCDKILTSLESPFYHTDIKPFILDHSVGAYPWKSEVDRPIIYADYYYIEALKERLAYEK